VIVKSIIRLNFVSHTRSIIKIMAQFDIISTQFAGPSEPEELQVNIDNPDEMALHEDPSHNVPDNVEIVPPGGTPSEELWVHQENYHLTITLGEDGGDNPMVVSDTGYYDGTEDLKYVDVVVAEYANGKKRGRKVRRRSKRVTYIN
jgi:hypothetical protein